MPSLLDSRLARASPARARSSVHFVHICNIFGKPLAMPKRPSNDWHEPFLAAPADTRNVHNAAPLLGVRHPTAYRHDLKDADFADRWDAALR